MKIERHGSARWCGSFLGGSGSLSSDSGAIDDHYYSAASRFGRLVGSNPEELLAAAHAGCFNMVLASVLAEASLVATKLHTAATVTLEQQYGKIVITKVHLELLAKVPSVNVEAFRKFARVARGKCPLTRLLNVEVTLDIGIVND